jgi:hypothetical protein
MRGPVTRGESASRAFAGRAASCALKLVLLLLFVPILVGCKGADPAHYSTVLDSLKVPSGWQLVRTYVKAPSGGDLACTPVATPDCPSVSRYYLVTNSPVAQLYASSKDIVTTAGFAIDRELFASCNAPAGLAACGATAKQGADWVDIGVYRPGDSAGDVVPGRDGAAIVVITAHGS